MPHHEYTRFDEGLEERLDVGCIIYDVLPVAAAARQLVDVLPQDARANRMKGACKRLGGELQQVRACPESLGDLSSLGGLGFGAARVKSCEAYACSKQRGSVHAPRHCLTPDHRPDASIDGSLKPRSLACIR